MILPTRIVAGMIGNGRVHLQQQGKHLNKNITLQGKQWERSKNGIQNKKEKEVGRSKSIYRKNKEDTERSPSSTKEEMKRQVDRKKGEGKEY